MGKVSNGLFLVTCLSITAGLLWSYNTFQNYFGQNSEASLQAKHLEKELQAEKFRRVLAENRLQDFTQGVASVLPTNLEQNLADRGYELKQLSSSVRLPASDKMDLSGVIFERGKAFFSEKKYPMAIAQFEKLIADYPLSRHVVESNFFLAESSFLSKNFELTLSTVDRMIDQYPDNDLTGFGLIRVAQISQQSNRLEEASEIYQTILSNFRNGALVEQTRRLAKSLDQQ